MEQNQEEASADQDVLPGAAIFSPARRFLKFTSETASVKN